MCLEFKNSMHYIYTQAYIDIFICAYTNTNIYIYIYIYIYMYIFTLDIMIKFNQKYI